ncbi:methylmalonyl-CoA mutase subunit beta [Bacillus sp. UNC41MFS5]|uniref:methylmalonyl-CoA mutase subunit beta n=1 Tax=Bacillus sp. UNC41MFS5 TaxID=1449046 RepID=UPI0005529C07|nr:methylmalonyl-CoA mutase subunit beta [Bacillus sp. UNC41MFS5]
MRSLENLKNQSFSSISEQAWTEKAEQSLKGKSVESLQTTTYENIILKPLYTRQDECPVPEYPGGSDFRRGIYPLGYLTNDWKVAQRLSCKSVEELQAKLHQLFKKGQSAISFNVSKSLLGGSQNLGKILADSYTQYPFSIDAKELQSTFLTELELIVEEDASEKISGYIGSDPVAIFAKEGVISEAIFKDWVNNISNAAEKFPNLRTILIDTSAYHNGGASAAQELGIAIAEGIFYLEHLQDAGMDLDAIFTKMIFQFSIGSNFFMEIAKLRAARVLWSRVSSVYGANEDKSRMNIAAETSTITKTLHDPYVNLLRAGNEAFAAVVGGIQYLHVSPFDDLTGVTSFSDRIARNTQLILKEEAQLQKVIDPAGGSWYVEHLTNELAEKAWGFFQRIDAHGGILEVLKSKWLQQEIAAVYEKKIDDIQTRRKSIVGTNVYANLDEMVTYKSLPEKNSYFANGKNSLINIEAIPDRRLAEPFEELRKKSFDFEGKLGSKPSVGMICLGGLKQHKARLDFMKGFLAAGGLKAVKSNSIISVENARQFVLEHPAKHYCLCGTNDQYEIIGHGILNVLKTEFPERTFYLAGLPEKEKQDLWMDEGIKQFIHMKSNCYETLLSILSELEVSKVEETKA